MSDTDSYSEDDDDEDTPSFYTIRLFNEHHIMTNKKEISKTVQQAPIISDEKLEFGEALANVYPILDLIFKYLDVLTLRQCSKVCKSWNTIANRSISMKPLYPRCLHLKQPCGHYLRSLGLKKLQSNISNIQIEPTFSIVFFLYKKISLDHFICIHQPDSNICQERITFAEYIENRLFPRSEIFALGCRSLNSYMVDDELSNGKNYLFNGIAIPQIANIKSVCFRFQKKVDSITDVINDAVPTDEKIECFLMFNSNFSKRNVQTVISAIAARQNVKNLVLGGGTVQGGIKTFSSRLRRSLNYKNDLYCVALLRKRGSDADFNAYSYVIKRTVRETREELQKHFIKLRDCASLRKYGAAFRFACVSRSYPELEVELFKEHFPSYPLIGFDGDGEIGSTVLKTVATEEPSKKRRRKQNCIYTHLGASVYVLLTWGPNIKR